jgi:lysophospholipid acyltransferase (LPLAT)-like uncharacterized protein
MLSAPQRRNARRRAGLIALKTFAPSLVRALASTWRVVHLERSLLDAQLEQGGALICMWHGRMLLGVPLFHRDGFHVLVSRSGDGDLSEELLTAFGYGVLRGSSSKGGARALRAMLTLLRAGKAVVVTPDGPRGPRHSMNAGLAWMARATGYPIFPLGLVADRAWRTRSWDRFTVPKPGARVAAAFGEPVHVARDASDATLRNLSTEIGERTLELERAGFARLGVEPDW